MFALNGFFATTCYLFIYLFFLAEASYLHLQCCCCLFNLQAWHVYTPSAVLKWTSTSMVGFTGNERGFCHILLNSKKKKKEVQWLCICSDHSQSIINTLQWTLAKLTFFVVGLPSSHLQGHRDTGLFPLFLKQPRQIYEDVGSCTQTWFSLCLGSEEEHLSAAHVSGLQDH